MSTVKYQVFISSTYTDLKDERDEVIKAVLEMGHIPVGMEMFSAADEEQWKLISRQIDQSDYYVVIIAHRYGSVVGKKSYTEKEYDYAVKKDVPVIGFVIDNSARWPKDKIETDAKKIKCIDLFKEKVKRKTVGFWSEKDELCGKVSRALSKLITTNPRPGWIRTTETVNPEVVNEMSRLSSENARLSIENTQLKKRLEENQKVDNSHFSQGEDKVDIRFSLFIDKLENKDNVNISWDNLFLEIGKKLLEDTSEFSVRKTITEIIITKLELRAELHGLLNNKDLSPIIKEEEILKIKTQLIALGYIDVQVITTPNNSGLSIGGIFNNSQPFWILTSLGKRKLAELSAILRCTEQKIGPDEM